MALIEKNREPSANELRWFGLLMLAFFALLGWLFGYGDGGPGIVAWVLWSIGLLVCATYYAVAPARRLMYLAWMAVVYPIGWVVSHVVLAIAWYLVMTPIGLAMRLGGYDPLRRSFDPHARSYWADHVPPTDTERYFRQY